MSDWTKEPWSACEPTDTLHAIRAKSGRVVADVGYSDTDTQNRANARRICACVNALEGLNDDALAGGWSFRGIEKYAKGLECQRDELLQELRYIANADTVEWDDPTDFEAWAKNRARAAIAKVESAK
jgi:hypothetical protein